jgi:hypothetical protein
MAGTKKHGSSVAAEMRQEAGGGGSAEGVNRVTNERGWVGGSFPDRASAERAYELIIDRGYSPEEISLMMSDETRRRDFLSEGGETDLGNKVLAGGESTAAKGSARGALIGAVLALGSNLLLPGFGLVIGGPLFVGLGAISGGMVGALNSSGIPWDQAEKYESDVKRGHVILGVTPHTEEDAEYFEREWRRI